MKHLFYIILFNVLLFSAKAQDITLQVHQKAPLQITSASTVFNLVKGKKMVLGDDVLFSGGTSPYQASWSSSGWTKDSIGNKIHVAPTQSTIYTLKVTDANNCTLEQPFQVNVFLPLQLGLTTYQISCFGKKDGAIIMTATGGALPISYKWSDGSSAMARINLGPGTYLVIVTDALGQRRDTSVTLLESSEVHYFSDESVCDGSSILFNGLELTEAGVYSGTFKTKGGCDSIVTINLSVTPNYFETIEATICQGDSYFFAGKERTETGQYIDSLKTISLCDSIIMLNLTVNKIFSKTINVSICQGDTYLFAGEDRIDSGQYEDSLKSINGCDSIITLNLIVNPVYKKSIQATICQNETYLFAGNELAETGQYQNILKTLSGCDSTIILNLTVNPGYTQNIDALICEGETYLFGGSERSETGLYQYRLKTITGCDSIFALNLIVSPRFSQFIDVDICQGESYLFAGNELVKTGQYENKLQSISGCDSFIVLNLEVNPLPEVPVITQNKNSLSSSSSFGNLWFKDDLVVSGGLNQTLNITTSGNYLVLVTNSNGCSVKSETYEAIYTSSPEIHTGVLNCNIFPNPSEGLFTVEFFTEKPETVLLKLISVDGKTIMKNQFVDLYGNSSILFGKEDLVNGIYTLQIRVGTRFINKKLIVNSNRNIH
jgi:hypothetical protein